MMTLTDDELFELRYLSRQKAGYPRVEPGSDPNLDRLDSLGLITRSSGLWRIMPAELSAFEALERQV